ncbi:MAG TPA: hypothetical protein DDZ80_07460 [Cyanobacteria bacterium UBA8803]|nr:hypothetical protein [Cyanobacteria bacterium UBA9273]HBL58348.1 hypothetical protein [Cyanobacteria bacterium UBA8803]
MARAIERIEQDLAALENAIALLATEFHASYSQYLTVLGQAMRQQLMLAAYQVCTQGYPESFLGLSFNERQQLQQSLRKLVGEAQEQLLSSLEDPNHLSETDSQEQQQSNSEELPESRQPTIQEELLESLEMLVDSNITQAAPQTLGLAKAQPSRSGQLLQWQEEIEQTISQILQKVSVQTNRLLQQTRIIPDKLPAQVLEAAAKSEASGEPTPGAANLLNLLVETKNEEDSEDSTLTRIIAINLRLSEIEFADPNLATARKQIRNLFAKAKKLHREYRKIQRERSVAQAEAAWRACWFDD